MKLRFKRSSVTHSFLGFAAVALLARYVAVPVSAVPFSTAPQIYLESCPDSVGRSNSDVGVEVEYCAIDGQVLCMACMRSLCNDQFESEIDRLYECKQCPFPETGCEKSITSDPFTAGDCEYNDWQADCDGDGDLDTVQWMHCDSTMMSWQFSCGPCESEN
jgi:hypothetical protein